MNRRFALILIIGLLAIVGFVGLLIYSSRSVQDEETNNQQTELQVKKVLDEAVTSPIGSLNNQSLWYFNSEGKLFAARTDGSNLSEFPLPNTIPNIRAALWPKTGNDFLVIWGDGVVNKSYYDSIAKVFINLSQNMQYIDWLPDGKRVVYIWKSDATHQQLVMANADGTGYKTISDVFWPDLALKAGGDGKTVLMYRTSIQGQENKIYAANLETGKIETLVNEGKNTAALWISNNEFIFLREGRVYLFDLSTKQSTDLNLTTNLDRVVVDANRILYGNVEGKFVRINLSNKNIENYFDPANDVIVKNIFLIGSTVYFVDSSDNKLYMISK